MIASPGPQALAAALTVFIAAFPHGWAGSQDSPESQTGTSSEGTATTPAPEQPQQAAWRFGGFGDVGYLHDFNDPSNHLFRSRGTTFHVNELDLNMAGAYLKKTPTEQSRFGVEVTVHAGKDDEVFGFSATAPNICC